jgi:S-DNA-T family DNA segregation ATPase FtsK/SpoIIIE
VTVEYFDDDAERVQVYPDALGGPVDGPDEHRTIYADVVEREHELRPIVPAWVRNRAQRREVARTGVSLAAYHVAYHATRAPKYAVKVAVWAPVGLVRGVWKLWAWSFDLEGFGIRQDAASRNAVADYVTLSRQRDRRVGGRLWFTLPLLIVAAVAVWLLIAKAPHWARWVALAAVVPAVAVYGRPADRPITDRVTIGAPFTKLTAEMVRAALCALGLSKLKEPGDVKFEQPGVHRADGGWLAPVLLPAGMEAIKVIEARGGLSSALRLPLDQVWPEQGPEHTGQLHLWVSPRPVSKMPAPRWSLLNASAWSSFFEPVPVGYDERGRPVTHTLFQRNTLIGGQPGSGKSFDGRAVVLAGLLDPTVELWIAAFKASEDHYDLKPFASRYLCGVDEATLDAAADLVESVLAEIQRRQATLGKLKRAGQIDEGRTSPELARAGLGLHGLVVFFDEVHELFLHSKQAGESMARALKQGRSAGVHIVLVTQVAGRDSVPPEITRVISSRWCLSVLDQVANDQVMGTGAYKRGQTGTQFRPGIDAGWGVTSGIQDGYNGAARGYYPTGRDLVELLARIAAVRAGSVFGPVDDDRTPRRDILVDALRVYAHAGRRALHWATLAQLLADEHPESYADLTPEVLSAMLRDAGVPSEDVKTDGVNRKGAKRAAIEAAIAARGGGRPGLAGG